ncbi:IclR family transcriptional regulator [Paenibacillus doosanensis]|uniref:HTH-type transcriptional regulator KipR n=1 Tax=Paenibacillus konkukensis TaxID=2020716 RepID=A0ABY4RU20_9BACL|nr:MULTISPECIES: IclR family transcriptional regulator [Paenibacillus]MCS7460345.1 IclR family transcriptional regulator [Paenibacillus doosanensis]UQZ86109.1 HTH-type transcriptional regulator KipR [Paenibacillus konkukensis]
MQNKNKTVVRSMDILNLFLDRFKLSMNEIVQLSGIPKTSVHRMIGSLEDMGFLHKDKDGYYSLGLLFLQFGNLVAERLDIRRIALPVMEKLRDDIGNAVHLVLRDGQECIYIEKLDTNHPVRLFTKIGKKAPLYAGASSRTILAFMPDDERERYVDEIELLPISSGTMTDKDALRASLELTRRRGYSFSRSELEDYTAELSAPIFDHTGQIIAALSSAALEVQFGEENLPELIHQVRQAAAEISRRLGCNETRSFG